MSKRTQKKPTRNMLRSKIRKRLDSIMSLASLEKDRSILDDVLLNLDRDVQSYFCRCLGKDVVSYPDAKGHPYGHQKKCLYAKLAR